MKIHLTIGAAAAIALAACSQDAGDNNAGLDNGTIGFEEATGNDPATTNLELESSASATDQAINQTDNQSELGNAADDAAAGVENASQ